MVWLLASAITSMPRSASAFANVGLLLIRELLQQVERFDARRDGCFGVGDDDVGVAGRRTAVAHVAGRTDPGCGRRRRRASCRRAT